MHAPVILSTYAPLSIALTYFSSTKMLGAKHNDFNCITNTQNCVGCIRLIGKSCGILYMYSWKSVILVAYIASGAQPS